MTHTRRSPRRLAVTFASAVIIGAGGCNTRECQELKSEIAARREVLAATERRAEAFDKAKKKALAAEGNRAQLFQSLGLDLDDERLGEVIAARAAEIPTATVAQRALPSEDVGEGATALVNESRREWSVRFSEKQVDVAFAAVLRLLEAPPLLHFVGLERDAARGLWRLDVQRAVVPEVALDKLPKLEVPKGRDPWSIPGELGLCGAGQLRQELVEVNEEIERLREHAEGTSVELPRAASYEGLRRRAERLRDAEAEAREHLDAVGKAVLAAGAQLKAVVIQGSSTVVEIVGTPKDRARVESRIDQEGLGDLILPRGGEAAPGVEQIRIRNAIAERQGSKRPMKEDPE